jgi:hypothetical protein
MAFFSGNNKTILVRFDNFQLSVLTKYDFYKNVYFANLNMRIHT